MRVLVLQHIACEPPGVFEDVLRERGAELHRVELDEGEPLPDWRAFDAIVAMGGPMSVNDEAELPWLADEKRAIGEAVARERPSGASASASSSSPPRWARACTRGLSRGRPPPGRADRRGAPIPSSAEAASS